MIIFPVFSLVVTWSGLSLVGFSAGNPIAAPQGQCCSRVTRVYPPTYTYHEQTPHNFFSWITNYRREVRQAQYYLRHAPPRTREHVVIPPSASFDETLNADELVSYGGSVLFEMRFDALSFFTIRYTPGDPDEWAQDWMGRYGDHLQEFTAEFYLVYVPREGNPLWVVPELGSREDFESVSWRTTWIRETPTSDRELQGIHPQIIRYYTREFFESRDFEFARIKTKITIKQFPH